MKVCTKVTLGPLKGQPNQEDKVAQQSLKPPSGMSLHSPQYRLLGLQHFPGPSSSLQLLLTLNTCLVGAGSATVRAGRLIPLLPQLRAVCEVRITPRRYSLDAAFLQFRLTTW